jgi:hypothetical protein
MPALLLRGGRLCVINLGEKKANVKRKAQRVVTQFESLFVLKLRHYRSNSMHKTETVNQDCFNVARPINIFTPATLGITLYFAYFSTSATTVISF